MSAICGLARDNAENVQMIATVMTEAYKDQCRVTLNELDDHPETALQALRRCASVRATDIDQFVADIRAINHQSCTRMSQLLSPGQVAPDPCPYPVSSPRIDSSERPELLMARMSNQTYTLDDPDQILLPVGPFQIIDERTDGRTSMVAVLFQAGNRFVVAFRGTVLDPFDRPGPTWRNVGADINFTWLEKQALRGFVESATTALIDFHSRHPDGQFALTGHSLGGAAALILGRATNLPTAAFNAPAIESVDQAMASIVERLGSSGIRPFENRGNLVNYRLQGDWVSVYGSSTEHLDTVCTIEQNDPSVFSRGVHRIAENHRIAYLAEALVANQRTERFLQPTVPFSHPTPCRSIQ